MREQKKDITMHIVNRIIVFSFVAFVFLLLFSYDTSPLYKWCHSDTANYMLEGILVEKGLVPYIDFFEHKGPLMFVIQWMGAMLTGNKIGFLLIEIPFLTVTLYGSYKIIDLFYNDQRKSIIITIIALLLNRIYFAGNMTEDYCIPFLVWSMYFVVKYFKCDIDNDIEHNVKYAFFYGITFMVCVLIRMTNFLPISVMIITGTVLLAVNKKWSNILKNIVAFIIGAVLVLVPFVIYYIKKNAIYEMFYGTIIHNIKYTLKNKGNLLFYRKEASSMIEDQTYIQYIMNNDLRCLLGSINEFFMPPDLFMEIAERLFGHNQKIINELKKINLFLHNVTYKSKLKVLIHESELRKYMSSGKLHFFNTPVTLTFKERERHIEYMEKILNESNDVEIRLVDGDLVDDFKNKENPSLYLSRNLKFTKVYPESGKNYYFIISDNEFKGMCTDLFDKLWNARTDIIISNKDEILDRIAKSISYTRLISESFGENIE